jgi:TrmH family RNA methyltransferase
LDDLRDPGNLGTIIRTADWFGIQDIFCSEETVDAFNPKVVQATMGSLARVRVHYTSLTEYFGQKPADLKIFGATLSGEPIASVSKPGKGILLIGSEAHGISQVLYPFIEKQIRIPSAAGSGAESLNAAVATALVCYEFTRP